jgi:starch-binding outer membrane protein, SusD/RagB family
MKKILAISSLFVLGATMGCDESALDKSNPNAIVVDAYYKNETELTSAVNSIYAVLQSNSLAMREWFFVHDLRGDEMATGGGQLEQPRAQMLNGVHDPNNALVNAVWRGWYRLIHRANMVIEKSADVPAAASPGKARLIAEARFLKGLAYYEIASLFGNAPIYDKYVKDLSSSQKRSPQADVYKLALREAVDAAKDLPLSYSGGNLGRAPKGAAEMLQARIHLQLGDYAAARTALRSIVSSNTYSLVGDYTDNFTEEGEYNKESIFEISFQGSFGGTPNWGEDGDGQNTANEICVRSQEYSAIGWRNLIPSNKILNDYERVSKGDTKDDPRFTMSFWRIGDKYNNGQTTLAEAQVQGNTSTYDGKTEKVSWRKYSLIYKTNSPGNGFSGINMRMMRYADVLLLLAECENEIGTSADALAAMNQVRARTGVAMPAYPTKNYPCNNKDEIFRAVQHERFVELSAEQVRNFDLLRWRKNNKQKSEPLTYFTKNKHEFLPLPQVEMDNNPSLTKTDQNPGY